MLASFPASILNQIPPESGNPLDSIKKQDALVPLPLVVGLPHPPAGGGDVVTRARPLTPESGLSAPRAVGAFGQVQFLSRRSAAAARSAKDPPPARLTLARRQGARNEASQAGRLPRASQPLGRVHYQDPNSRAPIAAGAQVARTPAVIRPLRSRPYLPIAVIATPKWSTKLREACRGWMPPRHVSRRRGPARPPSRPTSSRRNGRSTGYYAAPSR